jgi:hypothetical protein
MKIQNKIWINHQKKIKYHLKNKINKFKIIYKTEINKANQKYQMD